MSRFEWTEKHGLGEYLLAAVLNTIITRSTDASSISGRAFPIQSPAALGFQPATPATLVIAAVLTIPASSIDARNADIRNTPDGVLNAQLDWDELTSILQPTGRLHTLFVPVVTSIRLSPSWEVTLNLPHYYPMC